MTDDNVVPFKGGPTRLDPEITKELDAAVQRHPAGNAKPKGPKPGTPNPVYAKKREAQARYDEQEAKRAKLIQIDQNVVLWGWLLAVAVSFLASAVISFNGITSVAGYVGLSFSWMSALFFFIVEFLYLVFLVAYLVLESRGEKTTGAQVGMWFFAGVAIYANGIHSLEHNGWDWTSVELWTGVVLGVSAPIAIISVSKLASRVVFSKAIKLEEPK